MNESPISPGLLRIAEDARQILSRLSSDERLSAVLPQARALAKQYGHLKYMFWLDLEIYGLTALPGVSAPFKEQHQKEATLIYMELHSVENVAKLSVRRIRSVGYVRSSPPKRDIISTRSIGEIERSVADWQPPDRISAAFDDADDVLRYKVVHVRAYLHTFVSDVLGWAESEKQNQALLGRDYRLVINNLDALATDVGQELLSALGLLRSNNPADWSAAALVCRTVILKLGRTLFPTEMEAYESALAGKRLDLKGERELNRLGAFIDWYWRRGDDSLKQELARLDEMARRIHGRGSKGKRGTELRHQEAQQLVVDTFDVVSSLGRLVGLEPISGEPSPTT